MPVARVKWLGETPDVAVSDRLLILIESFTYEEIDAFTVIGYHNSNSVIVLRLLFSKKTPFWQSKIRIFSYLYLTLHLTSET